jgi:butyryl-CoA dehydrogenase
LEYAKERPQGRLISDKNPTKPQVSIIKHADVKRMLLFQKAVTEGSLSLLLYCSYLSDLAHVSTGEDKENTFLLGDLLTPIAKSYPSEMCCLSTSAAVQILGGSGYTTDFPVEQFYREARIHPIHEGTTGIHGLDLLGRKITMKNGKAVGLLMQEIGLTLQEANNLENLAALSEKLSKNLLVLQKTTKHLLEVAAKDTEAFLADATLYLEMMGIVVLAWQWLKQAIVAEKALKNGQESNFYQGKIMTTRYFFEYELVKVSAFAKRLESMDNVTVEMQADWF